jgi:hypothetical protein
MNKLTIETFWNEVQVDSTAPLGTRVLPSYERKAITTYPDKRTPEEWRKTVKHLHGFVEFDSQGRAKFDCGRAYGIHSYQFVSLTA